jgi:hypothetical protein
MLKPTMIGGLVAGVAGGLPIIGALNCACCALIIGGGFLATFLYSKDCRLAGVRFTPGSGAQVGLIAGLFYAVASTIVSGIVNALFPKNLDQMVEMLEQFDLPPEAVDSAMQFAEQSTSIVGIMIGFFFTLLLAAVFSTVGGLIGGAVFKYEPAPPASSTPPPPPPGPISPTE